MYSKRELEELTKDATNRSWLRYPEVSLEVNNTIKQCTISIETYIKDVNSNFITRVVIFENYNTFSWVKLEESRRRFTNMCDGVIYAYIFDKTTAIPEPCPPKPEFY